ncbi:MAG: alcohol dehydrogenase catalytic domain-containing protein [Actinobacteria bacterium]|nr:alcohol dehydrogenase catalytic domain-containing protein [Actinomycetota bacterium]
MVDTMKAAVFQGEGRLEFEERPIPQIERADHVIVEVGAVGICGTDLHALKVPPGTLSRIPTGVIMGHEIAGRVAEVGEDVLSVKPGDHVLVDQNAPCGMCEMCRRGRPNYCISIRNVPGFPGAPNTYGLFQDGGLAKYVRVRELNVIRIDRSVPIWQAAVAEPIGVGLHGLRKVNVRVGETAVVLGAGPIGLVVTALLKRSGVGQLIVVEPLELRRQAALACGATAVINPKEADTVERVLAETNGTGADIVAEAVGWTLDTCIQVASNGARIILYGESELDDVIPIAPTLIGIKELEIYGVFLAPFVFESARSILESGTLPLDQIVSHRLPLEKVHEGLDALRDGRALKVVIHPNEF